SSYLAISNYIGFLCVELYAASFQAVYDANYIYYFIKVVDDTYIPYDKDQMKGDTGVDNVELMFFPDPAGRDEYHSSIDARSRGLSQIRIWPGATENQTSGGGYAGGRMVEGKLTGLEYKSVRTDYGYDIECVLPWSEIMPEGTEGNLATGKSILMDVNIANCEDYESNNRLFIMGWSGSDHNAWRWNAEFGELNFKGELPTSGVAEVAVDAEAPVVYYNLQGVRVANPENGTFIRVQGKQTTKVAL
ncbi:sugar-binding protein, partial [uncultured Duncaniella sp.]|uniref:sugar-binding protein n=1 Tax=uncultured Duncaniella sp. TaxID=2768039 RepID=UPI0026E0A124